MKKIVFFLAFWLLFHVSSVFLSSCTGCGPFTKYRMAAVEAIPVKITGIDPNKQYLYEEHPASDTIPFDSLGIKMSHLFEVVGANFRPNLIVAAMACSPAEPAERIRSISTFSSANYDAAHPKGTDLSDLLIVANARGEQSLKEYGTENLIYMYEWEQLIFTLKSPPTEVGKHDLTVRYELADGRILEARLLELLIHP